jgi:hypothetical protein
VCAGIEASREGNWHYGEPDQLVKAMITGRKRPLSG